MDRVIAAAVFDLDGVLLDSEELWNRARRQVTAEHGGRWRHDATETMQGMSSVEWAEYLQQSLHVDLRTEEINSAVVERLLRFADGLPLLPGAVEAVERIAQQWPLGLASSSNRTVIDTVLELAGLTHLFEVTVSSEEVGRGKPAPDVYIEAARQLGHPPTHCVAVEDSANGIRSGVAAGMRVVAIPNAQFPPPAPVLSAAALVVRNIADLTVDLVRRVDRTAGPAAKGTRRIRPAP